MTEIHYHMNLLQFTTPCTYPSQITVIVARPGDLHPGDASRTRGPSEFLPGNNSFGAEPPDFRDYLGLPGITWDYSGLPAPLVAQRFVAMDFGIDF